jgi:membrane associated rhomboid family serine protease
MDWSLVLLSQGIEATIENDEAGSGWGLRVPIGELDRAREALRLYRQENRGWLWRRGVLQPGILFDWASLAAAVIYCAFYAVVARWPGAEQAGVMDSVRVGQGEWWRLFTAVWLHADLGHLASNATFGFVLLGLAMGRYGAGFTLLASYLAGLGGNCLVWLVSTRPHFNLGASGMVMGGLGLVAMQSLWLRKTNPVAAKLLLSGVFGGTMIFVLLGLAPGTDVVAHLGGFLSGLAFGGLLAAVPRLAERAGLQALAGLLFVVGVVVPWWEALRHYR